MPLVRSARVPRDPYAVAARARAVLACPAAAELRRDGLPVELGEALLGLADEGGRPTLTCAEDSALLEAAARRQVVSLHLVSGVRGTAVTAGTAGTAPTGSAGDPDGMDGADQLHLTGRLAPVGREGCGGCPAEHAVVVLEPAAVVLTVRGRATPVPVGDFLAAEHALNRGYLQRAVEHANACHGDELRRAVSRRTGAPLPRLLAASLAALTPAGVELRWLDVEGAHTERLRFEPPAASPDELGDLLRHHLDGGVC